MNTDYLLKNFCYNNYHAEVYNHPHTIGNITYSSTSSAVISVKNNQTEFLNHSENLPDYESVFEEFDLKKAQKVNIPKSKLLGILSKAHFDYHNLDIVCKDCDGSGCTICDCCNQKCTCESCYGLGKEKNIAAPVVKNVIYTDNDGEDIYHIEIDNCVYISPENVEKILLVMLYFNLSSIEMFYNETQLYFKPVENVRILIMQTLKD